MVRKFGDTWWGQAWIEALEERALDDPNRLPRGRTYARGGRVRNVELSPGLVRADVDGTRSEPYVCQLGVRCLSNAEWDDLLDDIVGKASFSAALLSGELPHELGDVVLPDKGDLSPDCSCPDWAEPCKHVAALCYQIADVFDADPFALLLARGRGRDEVLTEIRERRSASLGIARSDSPELPRGADPGQTASRAYRRPLSALDRSPRLPIRPGGLPELAASPPAGSGVTTAELQALVADAARRSFALLSGESDSGLALSAGSDVVRRAQFGDLAQISAHTKVPEPELRSAALAWRHGEAAAVSALRKKWDAPAASLAVGAQALGDDARVRANTVTLENVQLRIDEDGLWWRLELDEELGWLIAGEPADDPNELVSR